MHIQQNIEIEFPKIFLFQSFAFTLCLSVSRFVFTAISEIRVSETPGLSFAYLEFQDPLALCELPLTFVDSCCWYYLYLRFLIAIRFQNCGDSCFAIAFTWCDSSWFWLSYCNFVDLCVCVCVWTRRFSCLTTRRKV